VAAMSRRWKKQKQGKAPGPRRPPTATVTRPRPTYHEIFQQTERGEFAEARRDYEEHRGQFTFPLGTQMLPTKPVQGAPALLAETTATGAGAAERRGSKGQA
jgi:hypothetical protein